MALDLSLLPFEEQNRFSQMVLKIIPTRELTDAILEIGESHGRNVPEEFNTYLARDEQTGNTCYGDTQVTPYGRSLLFVTARHLVPLAEHEDVRECDVNRAIWAFLKELGPRWRVALHWE